MANLSSRHLPLAICRWLILVAAVLRCVAPAAARPAFTDVTQSVGISHEQGQPLFAFSLGTVIAHTGGAAAADYDGDGWVDLFVTRSNDTDILYRNTANPSAPGFVDVSATAFGANRISTSTNAAAWGDVDNDGDLDLYVTVVKQKQHLLYMNQGDGTFVEQAAQRGAAVGNGVDSIYGTGVAMGDYDLDGYLDIYATEWRYASVTGPAYARLLHNQGASGPGTFTDETDAAGASMEITAGLAAGRSLSFSPRFADLDGDRYPDLAITGDGGTSRLFWNNADSAAPGFTDGTSAAGVGTGHSDMGSAIGDIDGDGQQDWFITDIYAEGSPGTGNRLFRNEGDRLFSDWTDQAGVRNADWGWGTAMFDYDNDGDLDITATNGFVGVNGAYFANPMRMWENDGAGAFTEVGAEVGIDDTGQGRGLLTFDYDNDGDLDLFVVNNGAQPVLYRNDGGNRGNYLRIDTVGSDSNRDGIGALIRVTPDLNAADDFMVWEVTAGSHFLSQSDFTAHFGLGPAVETVDEVLISWPSGIVQRLTNVPGNSTLTVIEAPEPGAMALCLAGLCLLACRDCGRSGPTSTAFARGAGD